MTNRFSARLIMIKKVDSTKKLDNMKKLFSAIFSDSEGRGCLGYYLGIGAKLFAEVLVYTDLDIKDQPKSLKDLHMMRKAYLKGSISRRNSIRKIVKKVAKQSPSAMVVNMERNVKPKGSLRQVKLESLSQFYLVYDLHSKFACQIPKLLKLRESNSKAIESRDGDKDKDDHPLSYISLLQKELKESNLGWPFHRRSSFTNQAVLKNSEAKEVESEKLELVCQLEVVANSSSVSSDVIESPRSRPGWPLLMIRVPLTSDFSSESETATNKNRSNKLELLLSKTDSPSYKRFKYEELKAATSWFSSENIIGQGGSSSVYKGRLPNGKSVAVKVLKPKKEAQKNFSLEVNIVSKIKHKHIAPLIGICMENGLLISVHDFYPKGSLDHYLYGESGKSALPWEVRLNVAIGVAEALNYLHNDCPQPVIHRDVKSSNILLTNEFQPQLSDFGLAMWGSADSANLIQTDVLGTFGYIAPEYFMYGRISDKIDVYSFGVVLLELLTGRKAIGPKVPKGQESLVKWAKNLLEGDDYEALLDPKLKGVFDVAQMQRMVLVAKRCISPSDRVRPKVSQILKLLRGEKDAEGEEFFNSHTSKTKDSDYQSDDEESYQDFGYMDRPRFEIVEADDGNVSPNCITSLSSTQKTRHLKLKEFLCQPQN